MLTPRQHRGFTLIEVMVALAIVALMVMMSLPSMTAYFQNAKIGSAAQTFAAGMQVARAEAIRRNTPVEFMLTETPIVPATIATTAVPSPTGRSWVVRACNPAPCTLIEAKSVLEGSGQATSGAAAVAVTGTASAGPAFTGSVIFDGFGATNSPGDILLLVNNPAGGQCAPTGPMQCLNVRAAPGGQIRVCDPRATAAGDSRRCV